jgi:hypothetical protein
MGYTKRQFIAGAFEEMGIASYAFDISPEEYEAAMRRLDAMMSEWNAKGIRLGYPIPGSPNDSDLDEPSQVPDSANEAIITNLAVRLAPSKGKVLSPDTKATAKFSYNTLLARACYPPQMHMPTTMPSGAGNKPNMTTNSTFILPSEETIDAGTDSIISFD